MLGRQSFQLMGLGIDLNYEILPYNIHKLFKKKKAMIHRVFTHVNRILYV